MIIAEGAYDCDPVAQALLAKQPDAKVVVRPLTTGVCSENGDTQRDQHIRVLISTGASAGNRKLAMVYEITPNLPCNAINVCLAIP